MEQGPFVTYEDAEAALTQYCVDYQNSLTKAENSDNVGNDETPTTGPDVPGNSSGT
jgi:hypothetical protein